MATPGCSFLIISTLARAAPNLTWQIASGLGYQTGWAAVSLTYRYLSFDQGSSAVVQRITLGGPMMMVNLSF